MGTRARNREGVRVSNALTFDRPTNPNGRHKCAASHECSSRVVGSTPLLAQARPATTTKTTLTTVAAGQTGDFNTTSWYAGPRVWLGNLNGAVAFGGQIEKGFTEPGKYGPGMISGGAGIHWYSWSFDYPFGGSYKIFRRPNPDLQQLPLRRLEQQEDRSVCRSRARVSVVSASWSGGGTADLSHRNTTDFAGQAGARYFIKDNLALQGQIGFGYGTLGLGVIMRKF